MKDFSLPMMVAIIQEFLGGLFWLAVAATIAVIVLVVVAFARGQRATAISPLAGLLVAIVAMVAAPTLTGAGFENFHGALDWIALCVIGVASFVATALAVYGVTGTFLDDRRPG